MSLSGCMSTLAVASCLALGACGGGQEQRRSASIPTGGTSKQTTGTPPPVASSTASGEGLPTVVRPSTHVKFATRLPQSDGDADNRKDFDGSPDPDYHIDSDEDTFTRASYRYPDGDEQWNFNYGKTASPAQARLLGGLLTRYYEAARAGDPTTGCAMLLPSVASTITPTLEEHSPRRPGETCIGALEKVFERLAYTFSGAIAITHVRVDGSRAEITFGSSTMLASYIFFRRYGRTWKLEEPVPSQLP